LTRRRSQIRVLSSPPSPLKNIDEGLRLPRKSVSQIRGARDTSTKNTPSRKPSWEACRQLAFFHFKPYPARAPFRMSVMGDDHDGPALFVAISWGFKSPSPHQITGFRINKIRKPFSFVPKLCPRNVNSPVPRRPKRASESRPRSGVGISRRQFRIWKPNEFVSAITIQIRPMKTGPKRRVAWRHPK
jgi:hypothetical protein